MHFVAIRAPLRTGYVCLSSISLCERKGTGRVPFFSWWAKFLITSGAQVIISSPAGRVLTMVPLVRGKTAIFCNIEYQLQVWFQMHWYTWPINMTQMFHILTFPGPSSVPHIILHVLCSIHTSGGYFKPQKSVLSKIATFGSEKSWECLTECGRKVPSTGLTSKTCWWKT